MLGHSIKRVRYTVLIRKRRKPAHFRRALSCETARGDTMPSRTTNNAAARFSPNASRRFHVQSRRKTLHPVRASSMHVWLGLFHFNALIVFALLFSLNDRPSIRNGLIAVYAVVCIFPNKNRTQSGVYESPITSSIWRQAFQRQTHRGRKHLKLVANGTPVSSD